MAGNGGWEVMDIVNGVGEVRFKRWGFFVDYIQQEMLDYEHYIWRGQRQSDWQLVTTLDRLIDKAKIAKTKRASFRNEHLDRFQYSVRGRRGSNPPIIKSENEWWALGQHNGLATPLLDWTTSPFAAAYFAFISSEKPRSRFRTVYAINQPEIEEKAEQIKRNTLKENKQKQGKDAPNRLNAFGNFSEVNLEVEFIRPKSDENQRLVNQSGLFSRAPDGVNLDDWISKNFEGNTEGYTLIKLQIPNADRTDCLRTLNRMNINHLTLFPDVFGASKWCNTYGEISHY